MRDPYAVLGVARNASEKDVKSAFRKLAKQHHPDTNADDPRAKERFAEANQAYEILGDKDKRAQFDRGEIDAAGKPRFGGFSGGAGGNPFAGRAGAGGFGFDAREGGGGFNFRSGGGASEGVFSDIFEQAFSGFSSARRGAGGAGAGAGGPFGAGAPRGAPDKGEDIRATLKVRLEDTVAGEKVEAVFPGGKRLAIRLPDGVEDGQTIRLKGQGHPSPAGGSPGDALVTIEFAGHPRFRVEGRDLVMTLRVPLADAVLGGKAFVQTLGGRVAVTLQSWTDSGRMLRLKGKGLSTKGGGHGDLRVTVEIALPADPDPELADLLRARRRTAGEDED